jgi:hypothetical protein
MSAASLAKGLGWALTTFAAAGATGIFHRD